MQKECVGWVLYFFSKISMSKCMYLMYAQNFENMFFNAKLQQYIELW